MSRIRVGVGRDSPPLPVGFVDPRPSVRRVLWWYGWFLPRPIVVLRAGERMDGEIYAGIPMPRASSPATGFAFLIDDSTNSLPSEVLKAAGKKFDVKPHVPLSAENAPCGRTAS